MSDKILRDKGMEELPTADAAWNEMQGNCGSIVVKEEDISDVEPDDLYQEELEQKNDDAAEGDKPESVNPEISETAQEKIVTDLAIVKMEENKAELKPKGPCSSSDCSHMARNFQVVKKKMNCGECMAPICPECHLTINTSLKNHFSNSDNGNKYFYSCKMCSMVFKSNCALRAHNRIHILDTPYVCPDCGSLYKNIYLLSLHLINKCHHVYKIIKGGCKLCFRHNMALGEYLAHIEQAHIKEFYRCSHCGLVYGARSGINKHLDKYHKNNRASCLDYFTCSVCENLLFSNQIYGRHMEYHHDYSAAYRIGYLCSCSKSFNTAASFRGHLKGCSKRGVLPPQWTYLQVTLKTNEMLRVQNDMENNTLQDSDAELSDGDGDGGGDSTDELAFLHEEASTSSTCFSDVSSIQANSASRSSTCFSDSSSYQTSTSSSSVCYSDVSSNHTNSSTSKDSEEGVFPSTSGISFRELVASAHGMVDESGKKIFFRKSPEKSLWGQKQTFDLIEESSSEGNHSPEHKEKELPSFEDEQTNQEAPSISNVQLPEEIPLEPEDEIISQSPQEAEKEEEKEKEKESNEKADGGGDGDEKVLYGHIPCDHLGYLKTQQNSELRGKTKKKKSAKTLGCSQSPKTTGSDKFVVTSVLDEKTGFMKTKRVLIPRSELDRRNPIQSRPTPGASSESLSREILKTKSSTFFSCPFCSVLFPKHSSSFQKFRLHMECYHPDAGLDIDVDRSETQRSENRFAPVGPAKDSDDSSDDDSSDLDNIVLQSRVGILVDSNEEDSVFKSNLPNRDPESEEKKKKNVSLRKSKNRGNGAGKIDVGMKPVNVQNERAERIQSNKPRSANRARRNSDTRKIHESTESLVKPSLIQKIVQSKNSKLSERNPVKLDTPERDVKNIASTQRPASTLNPKKFVGEANMRSAASGSSNRNLDSSRNLTLNLMKIDENESPKSSGTLYRKQVSILNHKSKEMQDDKSVDTTPKNEPKERTQGRRRRRKNSKSSGTGHENLSSCAGATLQKECSSKSSPESSKTPTKEIESDSPNAENSNEDLSSHPMESNPRKESDVWSEFYKTLKVAETLKKTNVKDRENAGGEEASILTNYTNKRIVKKPKRYRESSDTEESEDEKQSPSFSRDAGKADESEDEVSAKKKNLIRRLENVDYRILDYVVNLLERKQKSNASAQKDSDGSLKSGKKKISNGAKPAGKQLKPIMESDFQDADGEENDKSKQKKSKRQKRQKKAKNKGQCEEKEKDNDKSNDKDKEMENENGNENENENENGNGNGNDKDKDNDNDKEREGEKEKENENQDKNDKDKDEDEDGDKDKDKDKKKNKKGKGKGKDKDKDKDKDKKDGDGDNNEEKDNDKDKDKYSHGFNVNEADWELHTGNQSEDRNGDKKRGRRKKSEPLTVKERRRSGLEGDVNSSDKNLGSGDSEFLSNKKKRKLTSKTQYHKRMSVSPESNEFSSGQVISTRTYDAEKKLTCAVCKETFPIELEFRDHIQSHRVDENNYQCMECGECFVVRPSLEKHLHAFHKIKDVQKYIEENDCSTPEKHEDSDTEPLKENQCKVCRDEFPTVQDLNKHFRIHGMAFLQQVKREAKNN